MGKRKRNAGNRHIGKREERCEENSKEKKDREMEGTNHGEEIHNQVIFPVIL